MHYYAHHIGDYRRDTSALSVTEHGVYRLLMDEYYVTERPLPDNHDALCRICRAITKIEREAVRLIASTHFVAVDGVLRHKRIDAEIESYHEMVNTNSKAGKASAEARRRQRELQRNGNDRSTTVENPLQRNGNELVNETPTNQKPVTNTTPISPSRGLKEWHPNPEQRRINTWFSRRDSTQWSDKEIRSYAKMPYTAPEDWDLLELYTTRHPYARKDILTLLNNWQGEIDRARKWTPEEQHTFTQL